MYDMYFWLVHLFIQLIYSCFSRYDVTTIREIQSHLRQTAKVNLYHVTKFPYYLSFTVHCNYSNYIHKDCSELFLSLVLYFGNFSTSIWNVTLNLSNSIAPTPGIYTARYPQSPDSL